MQFKSGDCRKHHSPKFLLKDDVRRIKTITLQGTEQFILQNLKVKVTVHPAINLGSIPNTLPFIHPQIMIDPPPNLAVPSTRLLFSPSPDFFHTHLCPSDPRRLILLSSDHTTLFQSSRVLSLCA